MWKYLVFSLLLVLGKNGLSGVAEETNGTVTVTVVTTAETTTIHTAETDASETNSFSPEPNTTIVPDANTTTSIDTTSNEPTTPNTTVKTTTPDTTVKPTVTPTPVPTVPPTTPMPKPEVGTWTVKDDEKNNTCVKVEMAVQIRIYKDGEHLLHNLSPNATTNGSSCNANDTQVLVLSDEPYELNLTFVNKDKKVYVQNISVVFPAAVGFDESSTSGMFFSCDEKKSYKCVAQTILTFDNVTLEMSSVQMQAFKTTDKFVLAEDCDQDDTISDVVPIAVGCALGALVIIVLIAYLVGRRRSRQKGYQSV